MSTVWELFKFQIDEKMSFKGGKSKTSKVLRLIFTIFLYVLIIAGASVGLSFVFLRFVTIGLYPDVHLFAVLLLFTQILSFAIALGSISKNLYHSKENDFLMALPCDHKQLFLSKFLVLYFYELLANTLYTLPILISFAVICKVAVGYYFMGILFLFLLPFISLVFAGFCSVPIMYVINLLKKKPVVETIVMLLVVAGLLAVYMYFLISLTGSIDFNGKQNSILTDVNTIIANISTYSFIFKFLAQCLLVKTGWWWMLIVIISVTALFMFLTILLVKRFYFNLSMKNSETTSNKVERAKKDYVEPAFKSILRKETYTLFRAPGNVFQYFLFTILMPFIVLAYDKLLSSVTVNQTGQAMIVASHVLVVAILAMLSNLISATAISREGGNFYITKMAPTSPRMQVYAKIVFNLIFTFSSLILTAILTSFFTNIPIIYNILTTLASMIMAFGHILTSILIDLRKPSLDWFDINDLDKSSKSPKISMALGLLFAFLMFLIVVSFASTTHTIIPWVILFSAVSAYTLIILLIYHFKINEIYKKVEC